MPTTGRVVALNSLVILTLGLCTAQPAHASTITPSMVRIDLVVPLKSSVEKAFAMSGMGVDLTIVDDSADAPGSRSRRNRAGRPSSGGDGGSDPNGGTLPAQANNQVSPFSIAGNPSAPADSVPVSDLTVTDAGGVVPGGVTFSPAVNPDPGANPSPTLSPDSDPDFYLDLDPRRDTTLAAALSESPGGFTVSPDGLVSSAVESSAGGPSESGSGIEESTSTGIIYHPTVVGTPTPNEVTVVPEPATITLVLLGLGTALRRRRA